MLIYLHANLDAADIVAIFAAGCLDLPQLKLQKPKNRNKIWAVNQHSQGNLYNLKEQVTSGFRKVTSWHNLSVSDLKRSFLLND